MDDSTNKIPLSVNNMVSIDINGLKKYFKTGRVLLKIYLGIYRKPGSSK